MRDNTLKELNKHESYPILSQGNTVDLVSEQVEVIAYETLTDEQESEEVLEIEQLSNEQDEQSETPVETEEQE